MWKDGSKELDRDGLTVGMLTLKRIDVVDIDRVLLSSWTMGRGNTKEGMRRDG